MEEAIDYVEQMKKRFTEHVKTCLTIKYLWGSAIDEPVIYLFSYLFSLYLDYVTNFDGLYFPHLSID